MDNSSQRLSVQVFNLRLCCFQPAEPALVMLELASLNIEYSQLHYNQSPSLSIPSQFDKRSIFIIQTKKVVQLINLSNLHSCLKSQFKGMKLHIYASSFQNQVKV